MRGLEKGSRVALLISECQRGVISAEHSNFPTLVEQVAKRGIVAKIANLAEAFRKAGQEVVHLHVAHDANYAGLPVTNVILGMSVKSGAMLKGSVDVESVDALMPADTDIVHSRPMSLVGFHGTDLDSVLRYRGITTVVPVGVSTNIAIPGLSVAASDLGYQVIVPEDCVAGADDEAHNFAIRRMLPLVSTVTESSKIIEAIASM